MAAVGLQVDPLAFKLTVWITFLLFLKLFFTLVPKVELVSGRAHAPPKMKAGARCGQNTGFRAAG